MLFNKLKKSAVSAAAIVAFVSVSFNPALAAELNVIYNTSGSVEFIPSTDVTLPVDPTDPDTVVTPTNPGGTTVTPGTPGPLSIDFASTLDFGLNQISSVDQTYFANPQVVSITAEDSTVTTKNVPNYVQVTDNRGTNSGWTLKVKQNGQLTNATAPLNTTLTGAQISLKNGTAVSNMSGVTSPTTISNIILDPSGAESIVMSAAVNTGAGTWVDAFGAIETVDGVEKNTSVTLFVPGSTPKDAVKYSTTLTWTLSDVVAN